MKIQVNYEEYYTMPSPLLHTGVQKGAGNI